MLSINLGVEAEMALETLDYDDEFFKGYLNNAELWCDVSYNYINTFIFNLSDL